MLYPLSYGRGVPHREYTTHFHAHFANGHKNFFFLLMPVFLVLGGVQLSSHCQIFYTQQKIDTTATVHP